MVFTDSVVREGWRRAGGRCECRRERLMITMVDVMSRWCGKTEVEKVMASG